MVQTSLIPAKIRENSLWFAAISRADDWIHSVLGKWAEGKNWEWGVKVDGDGHADFDLLLKFGDAVTAERFDYFEIANERLVTRRIVTAWGRLLDDALSINRRQFSEMVKQWGTEVAVAN